jgi:hypothetical protein
LYNQRRTVTGAYAQCDAAINKAQQHNLLFGWWSIASLLWNPISLCRKVALETKHFANNASAQEA